MKSASTDSASAYYLPYHEPAIITILALTSFFLLLNIVSYTLDLLVYCGLVGQIALGVAWGTPGGDFINTETQQTFIQLGYLGLLLMVYEGGLATSFQALKNNLFLSAAIAATGIAFPMGLSFLIIEFSNATPLAAFAAGAALCSTSLGTAFAILGSSGFSQTKVGILLSSAAMMDDIAGLIMVQVISNLDGDSFKVVTVLRPVFVSVGIIVGVALVCRFVIFYLTVWLNKKRHQYPESILNKLCAKKEFVFCVHTLILIGLITGTTYAGASSLTASYLAGASISWWDNEVPHAIIPQGERLSEDNGARQNQENLSDNFQSDVSCHDSPSFTDSPTSHICTIEVSDGNIHIDNEITGVFIFETYYFQVLNKILRPLFFASVGFSIPIAQMFSGRLIWRGLIYALLMAVSKLVCGLWLIRGKSSSPNLRNSSYYAAPLLGLSMVPRGEIGFLISSLAESKGIFSNGNSIVGASSDVYIIVTWAVVLCTIVGPVCVGLIVRRIKKIESSFQVCPLGIWGAF
ncbi:Sodium/hydrogen exchanger [Nadsonia fulvescens var. elongata DSM 6958]|uniref:Sodium/hydrogen exchanger n=1 Tax=Nadsonia fulvescens var. elongata DSM 6958 TaxID=857566 RepID=A0A1E3PGI6_9ASCO|nr:Sodium/hydrogen exchanger [Nadsonia fulvescens var. elongata DSM 6958]